MTSMFFGLLLWSLVHFFPSVGAGIKEGLISKLGENGYKLLFSLLIAISLVLIVLGWRSSLPGLLYLPPIGTRPLAYLLLALAFLLFGAAQQPSRIKRLVRHPQLSGIIVWSIAHLMLNGDARSVLLFTWLAAWAALEILFINRRDGDWVKPQAPGWGREAAGAGISLGIFLLTGLAHPYFTGLPAF